MWWLRNKQRDELQRFYASRRWRRLAAYVLSQQPICPDCLPDLVPAVDVHHVHPISTYEGFALRLSLTDNEGKSNLIGYCKMHHTRITINEGKAKKGQVVVSGKDRFNELNNF